MVLGMKIRGILQKIKVPVGFIIFLIPPALWGKVDPESGAYIIDKVDLHVGSLKMRRHYNSRSLHFGWFGFAWCSNLETRLKTVSAHEIQLLGCHSPMTFNKGHGQSIFRGPQKLRLKLQGSGYSLVDPQGQTMSFGSKGQLLRLSGPNGSWIQLVYGSQQRVKALKTHLGQSFDLRYTERTHKLLQLTGPGTSLYFHYRNHHLVRVQNGQGRPNYYEYSELSNLHRVLLGGSEVLKVTYDEVMDRVKSIAFANRCRQSWNYAWQDYEQGLYEVREQKVCPRGLPKVVRHRFWYHRLNSQEVRLVRQEVIDKGRVQRAPAKAPPETKDKPLVLALIDTGLDLQQKNLRRFLWTNPGESGLDSMGRDRSTNGVDDDGNGYVDDVHGWNWPQNTSQVQDHNGHGTHVAGLIVKGQSPKRLQLMILNYYQAKSPKNLSHTVKAIEYATRMGARIINYSAGGFATSKEERKALYRARAQGLLLIAAAGNKGINTDRLPYYPASHPLDNILSVGALGPGSSALKLSNFGLKSVDVSAPGWRIQSHHLPGGASRMTGTSQATALVSALASQLWIQRPDLRNYRALKEQILKTAWKENVLERKNGSQARIHNLRALRMRAQDRTAFGMKSHSPPYFSQSPPQFAQQ